MNPPTPRTAAGHGPPQRRFVERQAHFMHGFTVVWITMLALMSIASWRDWPPQNTEPWILAATLWFFWVCGLGLIFSSLEHECIEVTVAHNGDVDVLRQRPFDRKHERVRAIDVLGASVVPGLDSDGDPTYRCRVRLRDRRPVDIGAGPDRHDMELLAQAFNRLHDPR